MTTTTSDVQPHLVLASTMRDPVVTLSYHASVMRLPAVLHAAGIRFSEVQLPGGAIQYARNRLVSTFLHRTRGTHLLMVDDDVAFEAEDVVRMVRADRDVLAGAYPTREIRWERVAQRARELASDGAEIDADELRLCGSPLAARFIRTSGRLVIEGELVEAELVATGFLMMQRRALERMIEAYRSDLAYWCDEDDEEQVALFEAQVIERQPFTEDYVWSKRWRALGGRIWIDGHAKFSHTGPYAFRARSPFEQLVAGRAERHG